MLRQYGRNTVLTSSGALLKGSPPMWTAKFPGGNTGPSGLVMAFVMALVMALVMAMAIRTQPCCLFEQRTNRTGPYVPGVRMGPTLSQDSLTQDLSQIS